MALWASRILACAAIALGLAALVLWAWDTNDILRISQDIAGKGFASRLSLEMVAGVQRPLIVGPALGCALAALIWFYGPHALSLVFRDWIELLRGIAKSSHTDWIAIGGGTIIILCDVLQNMDQPIRTDEATSFLRYGTRSVVASILWYSDTNNHILNSILMRAAVVTLGDGAWAIRIPSATAAILCVPAIYWAALRLIGPKAAILSCALFSASPYATELATNARGYPLVVLFFLIALGLIPDLRTGRPGIWVMFVTLMAFGAWAVPIMLYPFVISIATSVGWVLLRNQPAVLRAHLGYLAAAVGATGALVLILYSPALLVLSLQTHPEPHGVQFVQNLSWGERVSAAAFHISQAWMQWVFPLPRFGALLVTVIVAGSAAVSVVQRKPATPLIVAMVLGPIIVFTATGFSPVPWWSLGFAFPLLVLATAATGAYFLESFSPSAPSPHLAAMALVLSGLIAAIANREYRERFPNLVGFHDAEPVAKLLQTPSFSQLPVFVRGYHIAPLRYYLRRTGLAGSVFDETQIIARRFPVVVHVDLLEDPATGGPDAHREVGERLRSVGCVVSARAHLTYSTVTRYECDWDTAA